eukprot:EG_transcript_22582
MLAAPSATHPGFPRPPAPQPVLFTHCPYALIPSSARNGTSPGLSSSDGSDFDLARGLDSLQGLPPGTISPPYAGPPRPSKRPAGGPTRKAGGKGPTPRARPMPLSKILSRSLDPVPPTYGTPNAKVHLWGLPNTCDELLLYRLLTPIGAILSVEVAAGGASPDRHAYVQFRQRADAVAAVHLLHTETLEGRPICAELVVPNRGSTSA